MSTFAPSTNPLFVGPGDVHLRQAETPSRRLLLVVIPCLDEENTVGRIIDRIPRDIEGIDRVVALVIDDGSRDGTTERARAAGAEVLVHVENKGLGRTFQEGVRQALARGAAVMVQIDGDGQFDATDIGTLVAPILRQEADMVTASRFLDRELVPEMPRLKRWGNAWVATLVSTLTRRRFKDVSCGFRAFSREALLSMNLFGSFTYTQETFLDLAFKGLRILEVPVKVRGSREYGESRIASSLPRYAWRSLRIMFRAFVAYRPLVFFGTMALGFVLVGATLLGFLLIHYLRSGGFSPHIWAGFVGGSFALLGILTVVIGMVGDMLVHLRLNQERILYALKRDEGRDG